MDKSTYQFEQLLVQLVAQSNKSLAERGRVMPAGLVLGENGAVELTWGKPGSTAIDMPGVVRGIQTMLRGRVAGGTALATCIAFPHDERTVIAMLENNENDCATISIPVLDGSPPMLDKDNMLIDDGRIHVFPVIAEH